MEASNFERLRESVVSFSSMTSMAGITVARFGVEREKNNVASFKILAREGREGERGVRFKPT
jgi:hypothetical protein